jgi:quinol-cytochrome oxidoreductase complex cytochrome b subunit
MTPSLLLLIIATPPWIALIFYSMKRSFNAAALAVVPALALMSLIIALPSDDDLWRMVLLRVTGIYMVLLAFLAAMGLMARYGVRAYRRNAQDAPPSAPPPSNDDDPAQPQA